MQLKLSSPKVWFYNEAVDFRKSIDGLSELVHTRLVKNPCEGIYVFHNRGKDKIKILAWHGNGFVLLYKRLERGRFAMPYESEASSITLNEKQLSWLLAGLDWDHMSHWNELEFDEFY